MWFHDRTTGSDLHDLSDVGDKACWAVSSLSNQKRAQKILDCCKEATTPAIAAPTIPEPFA